MVRQSGFKPWGRCWQSDGERAYYFETWVAKIGAC